MGNVRPGAVISNPVRFEDGRLVAPISENDPTDPQNIWYSLERGLLWNAHNILRQSTDKPYKEPVDIAGVDKATEADIKRSSPDEYIYTDRRNLLSFGAFLCVEKMSVLSEEFRDKKVVDIGSGAGLLGDDLRRKSKAHVTEIDISARTLEGLPPVYKERGERIVGDGRNIALDDGVADRTVSMYSTSVHTDTIRDRLKGIGEALRITKPGGRAFIIPLFGGMILRQNRWYKLQQHIDKGGNLEDDLAQYRDHLRQEAAIDNSLINFVRSLMLKGAIELTPILTITPKESENHDLVAGMFDVKRQVTNSELADEIEACAEPFTAT
jgi:ubiquinone/menaquinone biosynthesis C-methylase UbiE